jgi:two-component system response regulator TctD
VAKILIVDDYEQIRAAARRVLARDGHEIWDVPDGVQALELLDIIAFDLVLTDVYMAAVDGIDLLARLQQRGYRVPVIVMSGGASLRARTCSRGPGTAARPPSSRSPSPRSSCARRSSGC